MRSTLVLKYLILLLSYFMLSSCSNKKEAVLLEVLQAIEQDDISKIEHLCTPECFKQIQLRKRTLQSLLISDWDLYYKHIKCYKGESVAKCSICDEQEICATLDIFLLRKKNGAWLVDYNEQSPVVVVERFLSYLGDLNWEAAKEIAGRQLKKELEAVQLLLEAFKKTDNLTKTEFDKLRGKITEITYFNPTLQWINCVDDLSYPHTKICFLCDPLHGQTNEAIRVTRMRDKKWYVELYPK